MDDSAFKSILDGFERTRVLLDGWLGFWTWLVVVGVAFELVFIIWDFSEDRRVWLDAATHARIPFPARPSRLKLIFEILSVVFVVAGVVGELRIEARLGTLETYIRQTNEDRVAQLQKEAGDAAYSATIAKGAADVAVRDEATLALLVSGRQIFDTKPIKALRLNSKLVYVMSGDTEEAKSFCKALSADLHRIAGMNTKPSCGSSYPYSETVVCGSSLPESGALAMALAEATHVPFKSIPCDPMYPDTGLRVLIGPKPPFVIPPNAKKAQGSSHK